MANVHVATGSQACIAHRDRHRQQIPYAGSTCLHEAHGRPAFIPHYSVVRKRASRTLASKSAQYYHSTSSDLAHFIKLQERAVNQARLALFNATGFSHTYFPLTTSTVFYRQTSLLPFPSSHTHLIPLRLPWPAPHPNPLASGPCLRRVTSGSDPLWLLLLPRRLRRDLRILPLTYRPGRYTFNSKSTLRLPSFLHRESSVSTRLSQTRSQLALQARNRTELKVGDNRASR